MCPKWVGIGHMDKADAYENFLIATQIIKVLKDQAELVAMKNKGIGTRLCIHVTCCHVKNRTSDKNGLFSYPWLNFF
jgi:hypothetical protein